jgi:hypothetical protein
VQQLEVLLLLRQEGARVWSADEVAARLRTHAAGAGTCLDSLALLGLVAEDDGGFRYDAGNRAQLVDRLAELYPTYRTRIVGMIYSDGGDDVEAFADAFRLRKRKE